MSRFLSIILFLLPVTAVADGMPQGPYIEVSGHGELHVIPDMLIVSLTLEKTGMDATAARANVEARAAKVLALARKLGLADKDIKAPAVTVYPQYEWHSGPGGDGKQVLVGQHVTRGITLTLHDTARYGELVDGLFVAGVTRLDGVSPDRSDRDALQRHALADAVTDAHAKAGALAGSAGINLGAVYSISDQSGGRGPRPIMMGAMAMSADRNAAPQAEYLSGEIEIDADVQVYYLIGK